MTTQPKSPADNDSRGRRKVFEIGGATAAVVLCLFSFSIAGCGGGDGGGSGWSSEDVETLRTGCERSATEKECECVVDYTTSHYTADEINKGKLSRSSYEQGLREACT